jgi:uracil-DNA glycosylase family 4
VKPAAPAAAAALVAPSLAILSAAVIACRACPRLVAWRERVAREKRRAFRAWDYWGRPVPGFGDPGARMLIVGLAPAAHGANRTGRMFTGDQSGAWLYAALHRFGFASQAGTTARDDGLVLVDCYVTAALRCAPPGNRPTGEELARCRRYLAGEIALLHQVRLVVTLGRVAHEAWLRATGWWSAVGPGRPAFAHGALTTLPDGIRLLSAYHPSRQNTNTGRLTRAMWHAIFRRARRVLDGADPRGSAAGTRGRGAGGRER